MCLALLAGACGQPASNSIVIQGATLIDPSADNAQPIVADILIQDGRIVEVGSNLRTPRSASVIDAAGAYIIPGLADMHVHFSLGLPQPRIPDESKIVLDRLLYHGVTAVLNLGASDGSTDAINAHRQAIESGLVVGPTVYGTGGHINIPGTHPIETIFPPPVRNAAADIVRETPPDEPANLYPLGIGISLVSTPEAAAKAVRERGAGGMDAIKITLERGPTEFGNHHPLIPPDIVRAIVHEADSFGIPVFAHVSSLDELEAALASGVSGVVHAVAEPPYPDASHIDEMLDQGFFVMPTLALYESFIRYLEDESLLDESDLRAMVSEQEIDIYRAAGFMDSVPQDSLRVWRAQNMETIRSIGRLHRAGISIVAGTDVGNPMVFAGWSIHKELELLVTAGLSPMEALRSATTRAAEMIGKPGAFGGLQPGMPADLIILNDDPLANISNTASIRTVVKSGKPVDRESLTIVLPTN